MITHFSINQVAIHSPHSFYSEKFSFWTVGKLLNDEEPKKNGSTKREACTKAVLIGQLISGADFYG